MSGNKKIKIIFLNHWAKKMGGAEYSLIEILEIASKKFDCHLITSEAGILTDKAKELGVEAIVIDANKNLSKIKRDNLIFISPLLIISYIKYLFKIRAQVKNIGPDIIHANIPKSHITLLLLKRLGFRGYGIIHLREIFNSTFPYQIYKYLLSKKTKVISISKAVEHPLPMALKLRSRVIYNGIKIPKEFTRNYNNKPSKLLYIGRIVPWKNIEFLLEILKKVNDISIKNKFTLTICGDSDYGPTTYKQKLNRIVTNLKLDDYCKILPATKNTTDLYLTHDIFINASKNEPFGRVIAEAMSFCLPVVSIDSGGVNEIIDSSCGTLIKEYNTDIFAGSIIEISTNQDRLFRMGQDGAKRCKALFNKKKQVAEICNLIESISK